MSAATASIGSSGVAGSWTIHTSHPNSFAQDISYVRGVPTKINSWSFADPFGPKQASLTFPAVSLWDTLGAGELAWLTNEANLDIIWNGSLPVGYPFTTFRWEGYMESFSYGAGGLTVECKGALYQVDNYLAKPEYPAQPIPYELAIISQLQSRPDLRLGAPKIIFPSWWNTTYTPVYNAPSYMVPAGVVANQKWTGLVTRSTGAWEQALSSYVQTLLSSMYTDRGRWTMELLPFRQPQLQHRDYQHAPYVGCLQVDGPVPGIEINLSQDFSQSLNAIYGQGKSLTGITYSGQMVTADGLETSYLPLAQLRQVDAGHKNGWYLPGKMRREIMLQLQAGLEEDQAQAVANSHLQHFADPGFTGQITFTSDPKIITAVGANSRGVTVATATSYLPRHLIRPGMVITLPGVFGKPEGVLVHISEVSASGDDGTVTATVDSKYRDALTVSEVRLRGRDSLAVQRSLIGGNYAPPVSDELVPWSYAGGSGYLPHSPHYSSLPLFKGMPRDVQFPWASWTTAHPPSSKQWANCYIKIAPTNATNANINWAQQPNKHASYHGFPIKLSQAGSIRLIEIAAYDKNGNVMAVPFHVSFYYSSGVNYQAMPMIRAIDTGKAGFSPGQHYPFFDQAWESYNLDGTKIITEQPVSVSTAGLIRAYGTGKIKAGYWPGSQQYGDSPTGLLVDEGTFEYDCTQDIANINPTMRKQTNPLAGYIYAMIYCDAQGPNEVFFLGRLYRVEPGTQGS